MDRTVYDSVRYSAVCQDCDAELQCWGVQALVNGQVRWDVESVCSACGSATYACDGDIPTERRDQLLSERGPASLRLSTPPATGVAVMRVLRAELGIDLRDARAALRRVLDGDYSGTLPEMEYLARALRESGIPATATRP
ncbi:hypothetical protein [Streptomyces sp. NBC_00059]|uniref:hypothetical protein n=1 Tax=Streptomyces sp. NBC_00059 TaxID=2975635 RepID=UPI0022544656|nr:hypothetical protein [Streptomyces sp. NBC_00059]MCX5414327.1 hypothetical protein [Streptomyces sp. NBC_00059]